MTTRDEGLGYRYWMRGGSSELYRQDDQSGMEFWTAAGWVTCSEPLARQRLRDISGIGGDSLMEEISERRFAEIVGPTSPDSVIDDSGLDGSAG